MSVDYQYKKKTIPCGMVFLIRLLVRGESMYYSNFSGDNNKTFYYLLLFCPCLLSQYLFLFFPCLFCFAGTFLSPWNIRYDFWVTSLKSLPAKRELSQIYFKSPTFFVFTFFVGIFCSARFSFKRYHFIFPPFWFENTVYIN